MAVKVILDVDMEGKVQAVCDQGIGTRPMEAEELPVEGTVVLLGPGLAITVLVNGC